MKDLDEVDLVDYAELIEKTKKKLANARQNVAELEAILELLQKKQAES